MSKTSKDNLQLKNKIEEVQKIVHETTEFDYGIVTSVDKLLEEAHTICDEFLKKLDYCTTVKLLNLMTYLKTLPHLYDHVYRKKGRRVLDWLNNNTSGPEAEMCDFTMQDPVQLRKFVSNIQPRISTSDTNITLGKRKKDYGDCGSDDVMNVHKSSSDTRVFVHADWSIRSSSRKRRCVRN